jgi:hypothetical protein
MVAECAHLPHLPGAGGTMTDIDINERGIDWRESLGEALHDAYHPGHPWSGCATPDDVYDIWMVRFLRSLRASGYDVTHPYHAPDGHNAGRGEPA